MLWWTPERECDLEQISWSCLCSVVGLELTLEKFEERAVRSLRHRKAGGVRHRRTGGESGIDGSFLNERRLIGGREKARGQSPGRE